MQKIIVEPASTDSANKILNVYEDFEWVYLGKDAVNATKIERLIGARGKRIETSGILQETARELRQPYIDYIGKLSVKNNSLEWWSSCLSEKNPYTSNTFLFSCYLKVAEKILSNKQSMNLIFFIENDAVRKSVSKNFNIESTPHSGILKDIKKFILSKGWFLIKNLSRIIFAKYKYRMHNKVNRLKPLVLIHTFTNRGSFDANGSFKERYFVGLKENLERYSGNVVFMPYIWTDAPYDDILRKISKSEEAFLIPHAFLSVFDVFSVFLKDVAGKPKKETYPLFKGMDISDLIYDDLKNEWLGGRRPSDMLFYSLVGRLKENNISIDTIIHTHENHTWEKILHLAIRRFYPKSYIVGYQHVPLSRMTLNYFFSNVEPDIVPLPDRLLTTGVYYERFLVESNYPKDLIKTAGALRYQYLAGSASAQRPEKPKILVTFSADKSDIVELLIKLIDALGGKGQYKVILKFHPFMPFEKVSQGLSLKLPPNFIVSDSEFKVCLKGSSAVVYTGSATAIEAMAAGVHPLHVASGFLVDADRLDLNPELRFSATTPDELEVYVQKIVSMPEEELARKRTLWSKTVSEIFGKIDQETYKLFLR